MEGKEVILGPVKRFINERKLDRAVGAGDVTSVDVLSDRLGLSQSLKDDRLIKAYDVLIAETKKAKKDYGIYESYKNVILKRKNSNQGVENT